MTDCVLRFKTAAVAYENTTVMFQALFQLTNEKWSISR